jgi:hypothetical protein
MMDVIKTTGEVSIKVFRDSLLIESIEEKNLVVTLGKTNIAKLLGGDAQGKAIDKISIGTSGITATADDNTITGAFTKAISSITYPDAQSVMFHFDIDNVEGNGIIIREFGLLNSNNILCARKVRDTEIIKTNAVRLVGTWKITVS